MKKLQIMTIAAAASIFAFSCAKENSTVSNTLATNANGTTATYQSAESTTTNAASADELALGGKSYATNCAACHKDNGTGGKVTIDGKIINADNLTTEKRRKMPDEKYYDVIRNGIPDEGMPAYKDKMSENEIKAVVKYVRAEFQK